MPNSTVDDGLTPAEMSERTGVSLDTLRYYEEEGLIAPVRRNPSGHRRYSTDDVEWVGVLRCLRDTEMTIDQLRSYCSLPTSASSERLDVLLSHRRVVEDRIDQWRQALVRLDHKIDHYRQLLDGDAGFGDRRNTAKETEQ